MRAWIMLASGICLLATCGPNADETQTMPTEERPFDWQGHRGARGLAPENSVPAFLLALEYPRVRTLELDVVISADSQVVVSHEPWMSAAICTHPDGRALLEEEEEALNLYRMTYEQIRRYDCGSRGNERFPEQRPLKAVKPRLADVVQAVEQRSQEIDRPQPRYNIEIKSRPDWDGLFTPPPAEFARLVVAEVRRLGIAERTTIQSFDPRSLRAVHQLDSTLTIALLVEEPGQLADQLTELGYTPAIYSPYHELVTDSLVREVHDRRMLIIPWTVNDTATMRSLRELGVDGIITDYPNKIQGVVSSGQ